MGSSSDIGAIWKREMKFYPADDGSITCKCGDAVVRCADNYANFDMLVTTGLTRQTRVNILDCMVNNKIYAGYGPAGTGKTETCKDTMRMLGMDPLVVSGSDTLSAADAPGIAKNWAEHVAKNGGKQNAVIIDEFNRVKAEHQAAVLQALRDAGAFICVTLNPGYEGKAKLNWDTINMPHFEQEFTVPDYKDIARCLLANEGVLECDELASGVVNFYQQCREKLSKQCHYDFGMRGLVAGVRILGHALRQSNDYSDTRATAARVIGRMQLMKSVEADRMIVLDLLKQNLTEVADQQHNVADALAELMQVRHAVAVLGKHDAEKIRAELDKQCNATSTVVQVASNQENHGPDGTWTRAIRDSAKAIGRHHIYIVGEVQTTYADWIESLNSVFDDNKMFTPLGSEERIPLPNNVRVIMFVSSAETMTPASVSRMGWVA